jgi:biopolymer transport protein ExbD
MHAPEAELNTTPLIDVMLVLLVLLLATLQRQGLQQVGVNGLPD